MNNNNLGDIASGPSVKVTGVNRNDEAEEKRKREEEERKKKEEENAAGKIGLGLDLSCGTIEPRISIGGGLGIGMDGDITLNI